MPKHNSVSLLNYTFLVLATAAILALPCSAAADVFTVANDDFYVVTTTKDYGVGGTDLLTLRLTLDSANSWAQTWGTGQDEYANSLAVSPNGDVYISGTFPAQDPMSPDPQAYHPGEAFLIKFNAAGGVTFAKSYNWSTFVIEVRDICCAPDGSVYIAGAGWRLTEGYEMITMAMLLKVNANGELQWAKRLTFSYTETFYAVACDGSNVYCAAQWTGTGSKWKIVTACYNATDGSLSWHDAWEGYGNAWPTDMCLDGLGNVYVIGNMSINDFPDPYNPEIQNLNTDVLLLKYTTGGNQVWGQHFGSSYPDRSMSVATNAAGEVFVVGESVFSYLTPEEGLTQGTENMDTLFLRFNQLGVLTHARSNLADNDQPFNETFMGVAVDSFGDIWTYGTTEADERTCVNAIGGYWLTQNSNSSPTPQEDEECGVSEWDLEGFTTTKVAEGAAAIDVLGTFSDITVARWEEVGTLPGT